MNAPTTCPTCEHAIPADAPEGLCPRCLVEAGLQASLASALGHGPQAMTLPSVAELDDALPHLDVLELVGRGGMGAVYKGRDPKLDRLVAIKVLPPELADDSQFTERFAREARAVARLDHPNVVRIHAFSEEEELPHLVLEYVEGQNLRGLMADGPLPVEGALDLLAQIAAGLAYAHEQGVVHRDVKPENVLVGDDGRVRLADFGLAKVAAGRHSLSYSLTASRQVMGTVHYMAPEQIEAPDRVDERADVFAFGVLAYEVLTGRLPLGRFAAPSRYARTSHAIDQLVFRCLEREPEDRLRNAGEVHSALRDAQAGAPMEIALSTYVSFTEAQAILGISESELKDLVSRGELRGHRDGAHMKFRRSDVVQLKELRAALSFRPATPPRERVYPAAPLAGRTRRHALVFMAALSALFVLFGVLVAFREGDRVSSSSRGPISNSVSHAEAVPTLEQNLNPRLTARADKAREFQIDPYRLNVLTLTALDDAARVQKEASAAGLPASAAYKSAWIRAAKVVPEGANPMDHEFDYQDHLHRALERIPAWKLEQDAFGGRELRYGDLIRTHAQRGLGVVFMGKVRLGQGEWELRALGPAYRATSYATPPATMSFPTRIPRLDYWSSHRVAPVPVAHTYLRARLDADGIAVRLKPSPDSARVSRYTLTEGCREVLAGRLSGKQLYVDIERSEVYALDVKLTQGRR
jgi:excisionase family DNA binding protein